MSLFGSPQKKDPSTRHTNGRSVILLAMHGIPPKDFPERDAAEFFSLHARLEQSGGRGPEEVLRRHAELEAKMRAWPRTAESDPFYTGSITLASHLARLTGCEVIVGFNEFCAPSLDEALQQAAMRRPDKVVVITPP